MLLARLIAQQLEARFDASMARDSNIKRNVDDANDLACIMHMQRKDRSEVDDLANLLAHALFERVAIRQIFYRAIVAERKRVSVVQVITSDPRLENGQVP